MTRNEMKEFRITTETVIRWGGRVVVALLAALVAVFIACMLLATPAHAGNFRASNIYASSTVSTPQYNFLGSTDKFYYSDPVGIGISYPVLDSQFFGLKEIGATAPTMLLMANGSIFGYPVGSITIYDSAGAGVPGIGITVEESATPTVSINMGQGNVGLNSYFRMLDSAGGTFLVFDSLADSGLFYGDWYAEDTYLNSLDVGIGGSTCVFNSTGNMNCAGTATASYIIATTRLQSQGNIYATGSAYITGDAYIDELILSGRLYGIDADFSKGVSMATATTDLWFQSYGDIFASGTGTFANLYTAGNATAAFFFGDGSNLTGITATDNTKVLRSGDTMYGNLTASTSTISAETMETGGGWGFTGCTMFATGSIYCDGDMSAENISAGTNITSNQGDFTTVSSTDIIADGYASATAYWSGAAQGIDVPTHTICCTWTGLNCTATGTQVITNGLITSRCGI